MVTLIKMLVEVIKMFIFLEKYNIDVEGLIAQLEAMFNTDEETEPTTGVETTTGIAE